MQFALKHLDVGIIQDQILDMFIAAPLEGHRLNNPLARSLQTIFQEERIRRTYAAAGRQQRPPVAVVVPLLEQKECERALDAILIDSLALEETAAYFDSVDPWAAEHFRVAAKFLREIGLAVNSQLEFHESPKLVN